MLKHKNKGFTLPEIILSVAIISILTVLSFGDIASILGKSHMKQEEAQLKEIKKAMKAFLKDNGQLPEEDGDTLGLFPGNISWSEDLALYTDLSANEILFDTWLGLRQYKMVTQPEVFRDATFNTYYGVVYSYGGDQLLDLDAVVGVLEDLARVAAVGDDAKIALSDLPFRFGVDIDMPSYLAFDAGNLAGDDQFFKISDRKEKMANYETTSGRLRAIIAALQVYSQSMFNFAQSAYVEPAIPPPFPPYLNEIFYPQSDPPAVAADDADYSPDVTLDMITFFTGTGLGDDIVDTDGGTAAADGDRRADMVALMRLLGLPDSYCCSAMQLGVDNLPNPFYYFSNPRRKQGGGACSGRNEDPIDELIMPPRLSLTADADVCG